MPLIKHVLKHITFILLLVVFLLQPLNSLYLTSVVFGSGTEPMLSTQGAQILSVKSYGKIFGWGTGPLGGDYTQTTRLTPAQINELTNVIEVSAGDSHSLALTGDKKVWAWGWNHFGQLGDGSETDKLIPVPVASLSNVISISAGSIHSLALTSDGKVWAWGHSGFGQLGDGTTVSRSIPVQVSNLSNVISVSAGYTHSFAVTDDGKIWAWGDNESGQLGDGTAINRSIPVQVSNLSNVISVSAGGMHSLALTSDGKVWAWGHSVSGQLGDGTNINRSIPVQVSNLSNVISVSAGYAHSLAVTDDGKVWAWGENESGQLGDNTNTSKSTPVQVSNLPNVISVGAGSGHSLALTKDGKVWAWGWNELGQLGDGTTINKKIPVLTLIDLYPLQPKVSFNYNPDDIKVGDKVKLDASLSKPNEGQIVSYLWDFYGDGSYHWISTGPIIYYRWETPGNYNVSLKVTNSYGGTATYDNIITIQPFSLWEKLWGANAWYLKITRDEYNRYEWIKQELGLDYQKGYFEGSDYDLRLYMALREKIHPDEITIEEYILQVLHDLHKVDRYVNKSWSGSPDAIRIFEALGDAKWPDVGLKLGGDVLAGTIKAMGGSGTGISIVMLIPDLVKAGVLLKNLYNTTFDRAVWAYLTGSDEYLVYIKKAEEQEYLRRLRTEYAIPLEINRSAFVSEVKNELRTILLYNMELFELWPSQRIVINSPGDLRVYDSQGNVTGLVDGFVKEEIPNSVYYEGVVLIFPVVDSLTLEVLGKSDDLYSLMISESKTETTRVLNFNDISTSSSAIHLYSVDWDALSLGEMSITIKKDSDGDGIFEESITTSPPHTPTNPQPSDNSFSVNLASMFQWNSGSADFNDNVKYQIYFGTTQEPPLLKTIGPYPAEQTTLTYSPGYLSGNTQYYWQVKAIDEHGITSEGPVWSFTTTSAALPPQPTIPNPEQTRKTGDITGSGKIDIEDVNLAMKFVLDLISLTDEQKKAADVNNDGKIDIRDVVLIMKKALGLIDKFPTE